MVRGYKSIVAAVALFVCGVSAQYYPQNARIQSLGGNFTVDDINDVLRYSVYMNEYKDDLQITFISPIIGIKAIGENLSIGIIANRGLMLDVSANSFYETAPDAVDNIAAAGLPSVDTAQYIPHLIFGLDLGAVKIGLDAFYEYSRSSFTETTATTEINASATVRNPGVIASIKLGPDNIPIAIKAGVGFPKIRGDRETTGPAPSEAETRSDKGLFVELGGEIGIPVSELLLTLGGDFVSESYAFELDGVANPATEYKNRRASIYAALENELFTTGLWSVFYNFNFGNHNEDDVSTRDNNTITQTFAGSLENGFDNIWIFDKIIPRGGLRLDATTSITKLDESTTERRTKDPTTISDVIPTVGLGFNKGAFELDFNLNLNPEGGWDKLAIGPDVATVTATLRF
jgi:hypothetical protein